MFRRHASNFAARIHALLMKTLQLNAPITLRGVYIFLKTCYIAKMKSALK